MNTLSKVVVSAALALAFTSAHAAAFVDIIGPSYHTDNADHLLNNRTVGAAVGYSFSDSFSVRAGGYRNSYFKPTWFVEADALPVVFGPVRLGIGLGLATGYRAEFPHPVAPMGGLVAQFAMTKSSSVQLRWLPVTGGNHVEVFNLDLRLAF